MTDEELKQNFTLIFHSLTQIIANQEKIKEKLDTIEHNVG